jgi:hypothetical protein
LLFGYDDSLSEGNENGLCSMMEKIRDPVYLQYLKLNVRDKWTPHYDFFVVMNDQTRYPAEYSKRSTSLQALTSLPMFPSFLRCAARLLATHVYKADKITLLL